MTTLTDYSALKQGLRRYRAGTGRFLTWWKHSLLGWLPPRWQMLLGFTQDRLWLVRVGDQLQLKLHGEQGRRDIALLDLPVEAADLESLLGRRLASLPRWVLLPAGSVLQRRLRLPAAAAERMRDVMGFEIDRQTPFSTEGVRFDARVLEHRPDGQLDAELVVMPRVHFDQALAGLGGLSASLMGVDGSDEAGEPLGVNLLPITLRHDRHDPRRIWNWVLAGFALVAMIAAAWQVLDNRRGSAATFATEVEVRAVQARVVSAQRQQLVDMVEGAAFLDGRRASRPTTVEVLDELSRRLPENTYLEKVGVEGDRLLLIGFSPEASALLARLEGSPLWRAPALSGALQPDPRTGLDRFSLTAELIGSSAGASVVKAIP